MAPLAGRAHVIGVFDTLLADLAASLRAGDHALIMSNGGFGGLHTRLLELLAPRSAPP
jgi:UDP-N-acetylmuramate: L-alanyl-gamma-D-glutamyl-meso-diaminopimelate ligase